MDDEPAALNPGLYPDVVEMGGSDRRCGRSRVAAESTWERSLRRPDMGLSTPRT